MSQQQDEEDAVLAALHARTREQSAYEDQVIREATHTLAPSLPITGGLPWMDDTSFFGGGTTTTTSTTVVYQVLHHIRQQLNNDPANDLLCLQEQILLEYLETACGITADNDDGEPSLQEQRRHARRKRKLQQALAQASTQTSSSSSSSKQSIQYTQISSPSSQTMKRRKVQRIDQDPMQMTAQKRQAIIARRAARRQRRKQIQQQQQPCSSDDEAELDKGNDKKADNFNVDPSSAGDTANAAAPLVCPLCSIHIPTSSVNDAERDALLATHMQDCQTGRSRRRRVALPPPHVSKISIRRTTMRNSMSPQRPVVYRISRSGTALDDWDEWDYEDRVEEWIANGLGRMKEMKERVVDDQEASMDDDGPWQVYSEGFFVPAWIHRRLFGYQRQGLKWLWGLHQQGCGGCLGDEMGLGKTVSVCSYLSTLVSNRKLRSVLLVVPATMLQHWLKELAIWAPGLRRILLHTSGETDGISRSVSPALLKSLAKWLKQARRDRLYEAIDEEDEASHPPHSFCGAGYAVLTTYENVRRNPDIFAAHPWSYVVLDEAQKIRNPDADVTLAVKQLRTPHRLALTGTPIQNDFSELWSIFDFCFPSRLGTLPAFQQELADPIKRGGYSNATPMQVQMAYRCALAVRDLISPYLLRRTKKEVKEVALMPKKTEHILFCRLSETQRALYQSYLRSDEVAKVMRGSSNLLGAITMLRKICNHPDLVCDPSSVDKVINSGFNLTVTDYAYDSDSSADSLEYESGNLSMIQRSGKLEVLSKILPIWKKQGHRVLLFCQWKKTLDIIQPFFYSQGWKFGRLDGNTNVAARQRLVDNFNSDDSYFALLCTTRTGGVGLNLTGANRILIFDPDWNPQTDAQARERAWRFGQEREVTVYRLITAGTVEEKIYHRQIFKTALSNRVLQDPRQRRLFSQRDLRDLFTLKADTGSIRSGTDGSTDTATYTQGIGVVDPVADVGMGDGEEDSNGSTDDNEDTLKSVMRSKGLAGVFDHHFVEQDSTRKTTTVREMEAKAKEVARAALTALRQSVGEEDQANSEPQRFGVTAAVSGSSTSKSLLASLRQRQSASSGASSSVDNETKKYAKSLRTIQEFVRRRRPTTDEILAEFDGSSLSKEPAVFRRLLKSVASLQDGRWIMKSIAS